MVLRRPITAVVVAVVAALGAVAPITAASAGPNTAPYLPAGYTLLATPLRPIYGYTKPGGPRQVVVTNFWHGSLMTMPVRAVKDGYYDIRLPERPNELTTWVKANQVITGSTPYEIMVDLKTTKLMLVYKGKTIMTAPVGVGTKQDPTPTGRFFVAFYAAPPNAGYGPFVMVTSAHSDSITDWEETGDAMVAIHGPLGATKQIGKNGAHISHGCIRLPVQYQVKLRNVPSGTPVVITN